MSESENGEKPRMVVFAGPNGSGKSTINKVYLNDPNSGFTGEYINADDIAKSMESEIPDYTTRNIRAAVIAESRRIEALQAGRSFAYETVMSTPERVAMLTSARERGYEVALVFVTTDDPAKNVARVENRVALGGHSVEPDTIRKRYESAMDLLPSAMEHADKAVVFDNSGVQPITVVSKNGPTVTVNPQAPQWVHTRLMEPYYQRRASLEQLEAAAAAQGAVMQLAEAKHGASYRGQVVDQTRHHILQRASDAAMLVHDRALSPDRDFRPGNYSTVTYAYDRGKLAGVDVAQRIEQEARSKAFLTQREEDATKVHPELKEDFRRLAEMRSQVQAQGLSPAEQTVVMERVRQNMARAIEKGAVQAPNKEQVAEARQEPRARSQDLER